MIEEKYESGMVRIDFNDGMPVIVLPHQCSGWGIGGEDEAMAMISDLTRALAALHRGDLRRCGWSSNTYGFGQCPNMVIESGRVMCDEHING